MGPDLVVDHVWQGYRAETRRGRKRSSELRWALRDVSFSAGPGDLVGVIGGNGSGKTTLLQTVAGVLAPVQGRVSVPGRVSSLVDLAAGFHRELTGRENLLLGGVLLGLTRAELRRRYDEIVAFAGLSPEVLDASLRTYSAGMGLRLGFSIVVHTDPAVLLVDEVLAVGDEGFQARCLDRIESMRASGCIVVLVSHDLDVVARLATQVLLLDGGSVQTSGAPAEIVATYVELSRGSPRSGAPGVDGGPLFGDNRRSRRRAWSR